MSSSFEIVNFNTLAYGTVFQTQVINWIQHLEEKGLIVRLVLTEPLAYCSSKKSRYDINYIRSKIKCPIYHVYAARPSAQVSQLMIALQLYRIVRRNISKDQRVILQTRSSLYVRTLATLKKLLGSRLKIAFDSRGASAEEMVYQKRMDASLEISYKRLLAQEKAMISLSDIVLCVSQALIEYHKNKTNIRDDRFHVNSCNADSRLFFYDVGVRKVSRDKHNISENELIFVYSGGLDMKWHIPGELFKLFKQITASVPRSKILILSKDKVPTELFGMIDSQRVILTTAENEEINHYLNMADFGIIIRENIALNNVASPTKFAEYMLAGLPVLISEGLGDFTSLVREHKFGEVVSVPLDEGGSTRALHSLVAMNIDRSSIASFGLNHLSKESALARIIQIYKTLGNK